MRIAQRLSHLAIWRPALRVLCYHRVLPGVSDRFSVATSTLESQLAWLRGAGFAFVRLTDLLDPEALPPRAVLLTFDDGYVDNLEHAQPILKQHRAPAALFMATGYAGAAASWGGSDSRIMSAAELKALDSGVFEIAMHSHAHRSFADMSMAAIAADLKCSMRFFEENGITYTRVLAYPYGARPRHAMPELSRLLSDLGIRLAFRIGNRINRMPLANRYEVQRLDVRGDRSPSHFRRRIWLGRL